MAYSNSDILVTKLVKVLNYKLKQLRLEFARKEKKFKKNMWL